MEFKFDAATFEMVQTLASPLIATMTGFDPAKFVGEQSELFIKVGDGFADMSALFIVIGTALEDGKLSAEEINEIILKAKELPEAIDTIVGFFDDEEVVEEVVAPQ
jgi:tape measure domain-containing protein